ncbi:hypothetical protein J0H58_28545 [bacterium]|nr:hypothetical protein [bacterium]
MSPTRRLAVGLLFVSLVAAGCGKKPAPVPAADADDDPRPARPVRPAPSDPPPADDPLPPRPKPKAPPASPEWGGGTAPAVPAGKAPKAAPAWEAGPGAGPGVPIKTGEAVAFGPPGCPVVVVGKTVYDLTTLRPVATLPVALDSKVNAFLSPDGRHLAVAGKWPLKAELPTRVFATDTGKVVLTVFAPGGKLGSHEVVAFAPDGRLFLAGRHGPTIDIWDVAKQARTGGLTFPDKQVSSDRVAFTPDGSHFAAAADRVVAVIGTKAKGNRPPAVMAAIGRTPGERPATALEGGLALTSVKALAFSADGAELAAYLYSPGPRLVVWNAKGQLQLDAAIPGPRGGWSDEGVAWLPDGSGWWVNGVLFDRASRRVAVATRVPFGADTRPHLVDGDRVAGVFGADRRLRVATVPWPQIRAALKAVDARADAFLVPGRPVALDFQLEGLRGDATETRNLLGQALVKRLARDGIPVVAAAQTILRLRFSEKAGDSLPIFERQSPFDIRGKDTGRTATEANGAAVLELWAAGQPAPLWRDALQASSGRTFRDEINDATVRKSMLDSLGARLDRVDLPYFLPKDKGTLALPVVLN